MDVVGWIFTNGNSMVFYTPSLLDCPAHRFSTKVFSLYSEC